MGILMNWLHLQRQISVRSSCMSQQNDLHKQMGHRRMIKKYAAQAAADSTPAPLHPSGLVAEGAWALAWSPVENMNIKEEHKIYCKC